jgi:hypothetical protein
MINIKSGSIVGRKIESTVNNHGRCNRNLYNSSALICVYLPVSAVLKREFLGSQMTGLTLIHAEVEKRDINNSDANRLI